MLGSDGRFLWQSRNPCGCSEADCLHGSLWWVRMPGQQLNPRSNSLLFAIRQMWTDSWIRWKKKGVWLDGMVPTGTNFRFEFKMLQLSHRSGGSIMHEVLALIRRLITFAECFEDSLFTILLPMEPVRVKSSVRLSPFYSLCLSLLFWLEIRSESFTTKSIYRRCWVLYN